MVFIGNTPRIYTTRYEDEYHLCQKTNILQSILSITISRTITGENTETNIEW